MPVTHRAWLARLGIYSIDLFEKETMPELAPKKIKLQFGQNVARIRKARGLSQEMLSLESEIARSYLGGVERGQRNIALVNICKLAAALEVPPSQLVDFEDVA